VLLEEFDGSCCLPYLPLRDGSGTVELLHKHPVSVLGGQVGVAPRTGQEALQPADVVEQVALIHQAPAFQVGRNILEINDLRSDRG
jgi:hypothetical protein